MQKEIIVAGFGGQGVLFAGQILAYSAMDIGKEVTWFPSYGPEMRGGTANCTVVISDVEIGSPIVANPAAGIVMNLPSYDKYEPLVQESGVLVVNTSMIDRAPIRKDIFQVLIDGNKIAEELGDRKLMNMILVGALLYRLPELSLADVKKSLEIHLPKRHHRLLPSNYKALELGFQAAQIQLS